MPEWRVLAEAGQWDEIDWLWLEREEQAKLLELLRATVPFMTLKNGMEESRRHALPSEVDTPSMKQAAIILYHGELEAEVEGEPSTPGEQWSETKDKLRAFLQQALNDPELTKGDPEYSRRSHAAQALISIQSIEAVERDVNLYGIYDMDARALGELVAEVASLALKAGRHTQAAWTKPFEQHALSEKKQHGGRSQGGKIASANRSKDRNNRLKLMDELIDIHGASEASRRVARMLYGTESVDKNSKAIRSQWHDNLKKGKYVRKAK